MINNYQKILNDNKTLNSKKLILRRFKKEDSKDVYEFGSDEETLKYLTWNGFKTIGDAKSTIINHYWKRQGIYAIELKEENKCIGCIDFKLKPEHEKASFGYVLNRKYWGRGYMTEALSELLEFYFSKLDLNRVEATHYVGNEGSGKVMIKCGMEFEGIAKKEVKVKGVFHDVVHYGITKEKWLASHLIM